MKLSNQNQPTTWSRVERSFLEREFGGSNLEPVKSNAVLPTARSRFDIKKKDTFPRRNGAEMGPANLLRAMA